MAVIREKNNKGKTGSVNNFEAKNEKKVVVDFISGTETQQVNYEDLHFPHHKAETAAQNLRAEAITDWKKSTFGTNNFEDVIRSDDAAAYHPAD